MGLLKLLGVVRKAADAKIDAQAEKIENANAVEFGKQDLTKMKEDFANVCTNIGKIKGEIAIFKDKISDAKKRIKQYETNALQLDESGNSELAIKNCEAADRLSSQLETFTEALKMQQDLLQDQMSARDEMKSNLDEAESDIVTMQAMKDVTTANENLIKINKNSGESAVSKLKSRKEALKKQMYAAKAMKEESGGGETVEQQTAKALGNSTGMSRLEALRAKNKK